MPIKKIPFESELYYEIQAKYEGKINTIQELSDEYGITREYLTRYAKKNKWERGKTKEQKENEKQQIKTKVIPPIVDKIIQHISNTDNKTEEQDKRGTQLQNDTPPKENPPTLYIDEITANKLRENTKRKQELADILTEGFLENPEMLIYQTAYLGIQRNRELLLNHKTYYEGQEEKVGYQVAKNMEQLANSTFKYAEILGVVTKAPKIAIQNNNTATQEVKVHTEAETDKKFGELLQDNHFQNFVKTKNP